MTSIPPPGSRSVPSRARKSSSGASESFGAALKSGVESVSSPDPIHNSTSKKNPQIRIAKSTYSNLLATRILKAFLYSFIGIVVIYFCLAITIARILPSSSIGITPVKNITYAGGNIPLGKVVVVDMEKSHDSSTLDYFQQSITISPTMALVEVQAGPIGNFKWSGGVITSNEKILDMTMPKDPGVDYLINQYLVSCVSGACTPGNGYLISADQVVGQPLF